MKWVSYIHCRETGWKQGFAWLPTRIEAFPHSGDPAKIVWLAKIETRRFALPNNSSVMIARELGSTWDILRATMAAKSYD